MWVFYVLLFAPFFIQHFEVGIKINDYWKKNGRALFFFFMFLFLLVAFRHERTGIDTLNYIQYFKKRSIMSWLEVGTASSEFGFSYFSKIVSLFTESHQLFFAVVIAVTLSVIYPTYKRLCKDTTLTLVIFCIMPTFVMLFSGIRQMLAIGIGFIAYEFVRKKKPIMFMLFVSLAITFHQSAFMLIFMYPLYRARITKKWLLVVVPALIVAYVYNRQIFAVLGLILEQYTEYDASLTQTGAYTMLVLFALFAVFSFVIPDDAKLDDETIGLRNFLLFSVALQLFAPLHTIAMRMNYYYIAFIPLLIPNIISIKSERFGQIALIGRHIMVVFFLVYFFYNAYTGGNNLRVFPYHFFWESV